MSYPFFRIISLLCVLVIIGLAWLWQDRSSPATLENSQVASEYHFDVNGLKVRPVPVPDSVEAQQRPLFTPGRTPFVAALPPPPIPTPPAISIVEVPPQEIPIIRVVPALPPPPLAPSVEAPEPVTPVIIPTPPKIEDSGLQLKGVLISGNARSALISSVQEPLGKWMKAGETVAGWKVVRVDGNKAVLQFGDTLARLQLYVDKPAN